MRFSLKSSLVEISCNENSFVHFYFKLKSSDKPDMWSVKGWQGFDLWWKICRTKCMALVECNKIGKFL